MIIYIYRLTFLQYSGLDGNKKDSSVADNDLNGPVVILDTLCEEESDDTFNEISVQPDNSNDKLKFKNIYFIFYLK